MSVEDNALDMIGQWMADHPDSFVSFSGGKDSTVLLHLVLRVQKNPRVAFFDTGLTFSQTRQFICAITRLWDIEVTAIRTSPTPIEVLKEAGAYTLDQKYDVDFARLALDNYIRGARRNFKTIYSIYGIRASESRHRAMLLGKTRGYVTQHDKGVLVGASLAPLWNWKEADVNSYILKHRLPMNPVYKRMRELGIPPHKRRTGLMLGSDLNLGGWAKVFAVDPVLGRELEREFPLLRSFR